MRKFLQRLLRFAAYAAAGLVILLAIAVGLFRLLLPRLPEYQDEIKGWASEALGMQVEFTGMDARWGLHGPELKFYQAELIRTGNQTRLVAAQEVGVGVSLVRLLVDRTLVVDTVTVSDTSIEIRRLADGSWQLQGSPVDELLQLPRGSRARLGPISFIGENIEVQLIQPGDERPTFIGVPRVRVQRDDVRIALDAALRLPETLGRQMSISATHVSPDVNPDAPWNLRIEGDDLSLGGLSELQRGGSYFFDSGFGDIDLSVELDDERIIRASAELAFVDVALSGGQPFEIRGRFALNNAADGWLFAADDLSMETVNGEWPESELRVEASRGDAGNVVMLNAEVPYINLGDIAVLRPWLGARERDLFDRWRPDGVMQGLIANVAGLDTESPQYEIQAELRDAGFAAHGKVPGLRGFTGRLVANQDVGQAQINSTDLEIELPSLLNEAFPVEFADGSVIWRNSAGRTTILSNSIAIRNDFFESESNVEITVEGAGAPVIDLQSNWRIDDISAAKRFIPEPVMKPRLFLWFQDALLSGRISRGNTKLSGALDAFPFDDGNGRLLIEADVEDMAFRYLRQFPLNQVSEMHVTLDNTRLYTERNRTMSLGNLTVDAKVEIADLREPLLTIDSFSTGTLETIRDFAANSPISRLFGGQLDRISVDGEASIALDLTVPLLDWRSYDYRARIQTNNGRLAIAGLRPEFSELSGAVIVERELVTSESLGGRFLGEPVSIELRNATPDMQQYRVIASASGSAAAEAIAEAFSLPLADHLQGAMSYQGEVMFPRAGLETPAPLTVRVTSDLIGLSVDLPPPFNKSADEERPTSAELDLQPGAGWIVSRGQSADEIAWLARFAKLDDAWDFDRGVLMLGEGGPLEPEVRGLHIRGETPLVRLDDWLSLSRGENAEINAAERIRSVDLRIADLYLLGQHLENHQVRVDRSARDWLVQFDGEQISGSAFVPYDFSADRALVLDMERLILPGDDTAPDDGIKASPDPRTLPAVSVKAKQFAIGERNFGDVYAEFVKVPNGLSSDSIMATDASFEIVATGRWVADPRDVLGSRSYLKATLTSTNVEQTMARLNYQPGIVSDDMGVLLDVSWSGGPRLDFLETLDGEVQVRFGTGQLDEVDPGAGRMFGLLSIVALPRRLSLDFRDVFQKGFGFDKIEGTFILDDGVAYTCNLSLEGPAADIGIIGRTDLVARDYEQTAVVSANFGSTLPVVGALAAGPQAAAAMFLFSQIFKKPLQDISQVYYTVSGSWDQPTIESTGAEAFAVSGDLAGCLEDSG